MSREGELEFADARGGDRKLRTAYAAHFSGDGFFRRIVVEGKPVFPLELETDLPGLTGVVVNRDRQGDLVALGERDRKIEIHGRNPGTPSGSRLRCPARRRQ